MNVTMRLVVDPALCFQRDVILEAERARPIFKADPAVDNGPAPLITIWTEVIVEVRPLMAVIRDQQDGTRRDFRIVIEEVCQADQQTRVQLLTRSTDRFSPL